MSTIDMFKFWLIKELGIPLVVLAIVLIGACVLFVILKIEEIVMSIRNLARPVKKKGRDR